MEKNSAMKIGHPLEATLGKGYVHFLAEGIHRSGVRVSDHPTLRSLAERISAHGPAPYSELVTALLFGEGGYYAENVAFSSVGAEGPALRDFITCPEITPLFGASFAHPFAAVLESVRDEEEWPWPIYELGAGTGAFAESFLTALARILPEFFERGHYVIVEHSRTLAARQRARLDSAFPAGHPTEWVQASAADVELPARCLVFSNEMLDCWPFERMVRTGNTLRQLFVDIEDGAWVEHWRPPTAEARAFCERYLEGGAALKDGVEEPLLISTVPWLARIASQIEQGAVCLVDYGTLAPPGRSLLSLLHMPVEKRAAVRAYGDEAFHARRVELLATGGYPLGTLPYERPGELDLTCSVHFDVVTRAFGEAGGWRVDNAGPQERLLLRSGFMDAMIAARKALPEATSWESFAASLGALSFAPALLDVRMRDWFFGFFATRGIEPTVLAPPEVDLDKALSACSDLYWETALAPRRVEVGGHGQVKVNGPGGVSQRVLEDGFVQLCLAELAHPALMITRSGGGAPILDLSRPDDRARAFAAVRG